MPRELPLVHKVTEAPYSVIDEQLGIKHRGQVHCSCGHWFTQKGFRIHSGMMNRKLKETPEGRRALAIEEGRQIEEKEGWAPGTLTDQAGWPDLPMTLEERAERNRELEARQAKQREEWEARKKAEDDEWALKVAEAFCEIPIVKDGSGIEPSTELGYQIIETFEKHEISLHDVHEPYDW